MQYLFFGNVIHQHCSAIVWLDSISPLWDPESCGANEAPHCLLSWCFMRPCLAHKLGNKNHRAGWGVFHVCRLAPVDGWKIKGWTNVGNGGYSHCTLFEVQCRSVKDWLFSWLFSVLQWTQTYPLPPPPPPWWNLVTTKIRRKWEKTQ